LPLECGVIYQQLWDVIPVEDQAIEHQRQIDVGNAPLAKQVGVTLRQQR